MAECIPRFFYFIGATYWGYQVLKDKPYLPWYLGGSGDYALALSPEYIPFAKHTEDVKTYLLVTSSFHISGFFVHLVASRKNDFVEMGFHHIVALYLFGGLYMMNCWEGGAVYAFLHDIGDCFVWLVKFTGETPYGNLAGAIFVSTMAAWMWTRCLSLPYMIFVTFMTDVKVGNHTTYFRECFIYLLCCMALLHWYWFYIFC